MNKDLNLLPCYQKPEMFNFYTGKFLLVTFSAFKPGTRAFNFKPVKMPVGVQNSWGAFSLPCPTPPATTHMNTHRVTGEAEEKPGKRQNEL